MMKVYLVFLCLLPSLISGASILPEPRKNVRASATNAEIQSLAEQFYAADTNKAASGDINLNLQYKATSSQSTSGTDYASQKLFSYVNEAKLFARPTFAKLVALLDNYVQITGTAESVPTAEVQEQNAFIDEIFKTSIITKLSNFFISKGEIHKGKISGLHSWVQLYLLEKSGQVNYLSYTSDGVWTGYPDVYAFQLKWNTYLKTIGSFFVGSSPEFDIAMYTLCYVTRPDSLCTVQMGGSTFQIQTYTWANSTYGNGKRYVASSYPNI
eukprot:XP_012813299.1 PREDICTED: poly(U)-specific endoribonuclease-D isoform X2 [Xenopus tropicalis]